MNEFGNSPLFYRQKKRKIKAFQDEMLVVYQPQANNLNNEIGNNKANHKLPHVVSYF